MPHERRSAEQASGGRRHAEGVGSNRPWAGADAHQTLATVIRTAQQRRLNPHALLVSMLRLNSGDAIRALVWLGRGQSRAMTSKLGRALSAQTLNDEGRLIWAAERLAATTSRDRRGASVEFGRTREPNGVARENALVLAKVFTVLKETVTTNTDVAKKLDLCTEDI